MRGSGMPVGLFLRGPVARAPTARVAFVAFSRTDRVFAFFVRAMRPPCCARRSLRASTPTSDFGVRRRSLSLPLKLQALERWLVELLRDRHPAIRLKLLHCRSRVLAHETV